MASEQKVLLLGDEAIAQGALDAGISGAYAYPGTPSTEILEFVQRAPETSTRGVHCAWSVNEKTAVEEALGMSYAGRRAMVSMKHVGLNVAADPFVNAAVTGAHGGLLVVTADDPSMHSSQNEQDSRHYARFAGVVCLEPRDQQQAYDMAREAFDLSERLRLPVLLRLTTRLAHSRADVTRRPPRPPNPFSLPDDPGRFILLPSIARRNYAALLAKQPQLESASETSTFNVLRDGPDRGVGIVAAGIAINYLDELFPDGACPHPVLRLGQYPLPRCHVAELAGRCASLLVLEEGMPFVEEQLRGFFGAPVPVRGRLDGALPRTGELTPDDAARALGHRRSPGDPVPDVVRGRPPQLCKGCPHADTYGVLADVLKDTPGCRVFSDIGCYTLGALPPYEAIHTCVDMGASITMAKGAADAGLRPAVAVIGDSTFAHSGMTGLLDAVYENSPITVLILDNEVVGMTGRQESLAAGRLDELVLGLGVKPEHLRIVPPLRKHHGENLRVLREELAYEGVSVIIARRSCVHAKRRV